MKQQATSFLPGTHLSSANVWKRSLAALVILAALLLGGCTIIVPSGGISNSGSPIVISNQTQAIFVAPNCNGSTVAQVQGGGNLVDLGPANSTCEQVAYPTETGYMQTGYVPVYSIHRANNAVQCNFQAGCNLRAGPSVSATILYVLPLGQRAQGRWTTTGAIITDGNQYSWWEVIVPSTGQIADIYGSLTVAF